MSGKIKLIKRNLEGFEIYQREIDGYINATQISKVNRDITGERKDPSEWLDNNSTKSMLQKLSSVTGIPVTELYAVKKGGVHQGTWIHPRLAVRFSMWVNDDFSLLVEDWIHSWLGSAYTPDQLRADSDRVAIRDELKDSRRLALMDQVKVFLESAGDYNPGSKQTNIFFGRIHNEVNLVLTTERAKDMRERLEIHLGRKVSEQELLRDYFPIVDLANYAALCQAAANNIENGMHPINAVQLAAKQVLPSAYVPKPIDFTEEVSLARKRIEQVQQGQTYIEGS